MSIIPTIIYSVSLFLFIILFEHLVWKNKIYEEYAIVLLKLIISSVLIYAIFSTTIIEIAVICGSSIIAMAILYQLHMFRQASIVRKKFKHLIIMYITIFLLVLLLKENYSGILLITILIYGYSNNISDLLGDIMSKKYFQVNADKKSVLGIILFLPLSFFILISTEQLSGIDFYGIPSQYHGDTLKLFYAAATVLIVASFKLVSSNEWENFYIPVSTSLLLIIIYQSPSSAVLEQFYIGIGFAAVIAAASYFLRFLTAGGSFATFLLASFIFGLGGLKWSIPILTFFILSSLLSKVRKKSNREVEDYFEKTGVRDQMQVFANGGLGGILVIINYSLPDDMFFLMYLASLSAVCADTWATEIGTMRKTKTYNIINLKPVQQGVSGGISAAGSFGALLGSTAIALSGCYWFNENFLLYFLIVIIAGISGSFFDSFLGATIQIQFECNVCGKITEKTRHCSKTTKSVRGFRWITNDVLNSFAAVFGIFVTYIFWLTGIF